MTDRPDTTSKRPVRIRRVTRLVTLALGVVAIAGALLADLLLVGPAGFGSAQKLALVAGIALIACCLLPIRWNQRILTFAVSAGSCLLLVELGLRTFTDLNQSIYEADPHCIYRIRPNATKVFRRIPANGGERITNRSNRHGYRGDALRDSGGGPRIVVFGDSFIEAEFSADADTFTQRLTSELSPGLPSVEVINAGVLGYGPDQVLARMEKEIPILRPDLVIVSIFAGNDFGDLVRNRMYRLDDRGDLVPNPFEIDRSVAISFRKRHGNSILYSFLHTTVTRIRLRWTSVGAAANDYDLHTLVDYCLEKCVYEFDTAVTGEQHVIHAHELLLDQYDADIALTSDSASARYKVRLMDRLLGALGDVVRRHDVPLLLLAIPERIDLYPPEIGVNREKYPHYDPTALTDAIASAASTHGLSCIDLFEPFLADAGADLYFRGSNNHWNDRGQAFAAKLVADRIREHGWFDGAP